MISARCWNNFLLEAPEQIAGYQRPDDRATVSAENDQFIQVFYLQAVVERIAKSMRPVKQW